MQWGRRPRKDYRAEVVAQGAARALAAAVNLAFVWQLGIGKSRGCRRMSGILA